MADVKGFFQRAAIPVPDLTVEGLRATCVALKEAVDVMMGQRGVPEESVVLRRDLILTGIMTNPVYPFTVPPRDSFTPALGFGVPQLDTGIAYVPGYPTGRWFRLGSLVFFTAIIIVSNKGTAVGPAGFSLPYRSRPTANGFFWCAASIASAAGAPAGVVARIDPNSDYAMLWQQVNTAGPVLLTDANFTNSTQLGCTGFYEAYVETTDSEIITQTKRNQ